MPRTSEALLNLLSSAALSDEPARYASSWVPFALMLVLLVGLGAGLWLVTLLWTTLIMHRPPRMSAGRALARLGRASPADIDLNYEEVVFNVPDVARPGKTLVLAGWWIAHPGGPAVRRACIMLHGYGDSRAGSLAWARLWHDMGFHLLLLDLRAHGESGGYLSGGGVWERGDLHSLIDQLRTQRPLATRALVLFGVSYGGMIAAACAAQRDDLAALVIDSPVEGWASATRRYGELLGLPLAHAHSLRMRVAQRALGVRFEEVRPALTLRSVACPVLAILPDRDVLVSPAESDEIAAAVEAGGSRSRVWRVASGHNLALAFDAARYEQVLREFFNNVPPAEAGSPHSSE